MIGLRLKDRYRIERALGEGGMAEVYLAVDELFGRHVVVKVPHAHLMAGEAIRRRFLYEVQQLARFEHPHILAIQDSGEIDGRPFAVMSYLPGGSLGERLQATGWRQSPPEVQGWLTTVADALDFLHRSGALHRDVKPGNILFDASGHACLADFGIATAMGEAGGEPGADSRDLTRVGSVVGSPAYMPPEAIDRRLTPAYDQYSLGIVVYLALAGALPYGGETAEKILLNKQRHPPPSLPKEIPPGCARAVMRACAFDPADRFESCRAFADAYAHGLGTRELPWRRMGLVAAGLALVAGLVFALPRVWGGLFGSTGKERPGILIEAVADWAIGSTEAEIRDALSLCRASVRRCRTDWYTPEALRTVDVGAFRIDRTEVTAEAFARFALQHPEPTTAEAQGHSAEGPLPLPGFSWRAPEGPGSSWETHPRRPVVHVSFDDAIAFCAARGARLPTEAEWELAARGSERRLFPWGASWDPTRPVWAAGPLTAPAPVGSRADGATPEGVLDMAGNVWEWTTTHDDEGKRVLKGGSFLESNPANLRAATRMFDNPNLTGSDVGFRCVSEP